MTYLSRYIISLLLILGSVQLAVAEELMIIVNEDSQLEFLDKKSIADLYLGKNKTLGHLKPVDLKDKELRERFYKEMTGLSLTRVRAYWAKMVFTGKGRPPKQLTAEEALEYVIANKNSVAYVSGEQDILNVRKIYRTE